MIRKRWISIFLTAMLCINILPASVFAESELPDPVIQESILDTDTETEQSTDSVLNEEQGADSSDSMAENQSQIIETEPIPVESTDSDSLSSESEEFDILSESTNIDDSTVSLDSERSSDADMMQSEETMTEFDIDSIEFENDLLEENDEALMGYIESEVSDEYVDVSDSKHTLTALEQTIYDYLKEQIQKIAAGELSNTSIVVPEEIYSWILTYEELGVDSSSDDDTFSDAIYNKVLSDINPIKICYSLNADMPYQFYWNQENSMHFDLVCYQSESYELIKVANLVFNYKVASSFGSGYTIDTPKVEMVNNAVANAKQIVADAELLSDYQKLNFYKNTICDLVTYDTNAAETKGYDTNGNYDGSAWQLINVFDGDDTTNVVCEGFSRAFQLLCDETVFNDSHITCLFIVGTSTADGVTEDHVWNLVIMEDKQSYLVDTTNSEPGTYGQDGDLFLAGTSVGSVADGYTFTIPGIGSIKYNYDSYVTSSYPEKKLTLASSDYDPETVVKCAHTNRKTVNVKQATCQTTGYTGDLICADCGDLISRGLIISKCGHSWDDGTRVSEPTADAPGETDFTCTVCGEVKKDYDIKITTQPSSKTIYTGKSAVFSIGALGGSLSYQWQYRKNSSSSWTTPSAASAKTAKYTFSSAAKTAYSGYQFRCIVTSEEDSSLTLTSNTVTLTVKPYITITSQPAAVSVTEGKTFSFKISAKSNTGSTLKYQWQYSKDSQSTWTNSAQTTSVYSVTARKAWNGWYYRCIITDTEGNSITSSSVKLTVTDPPIVITAQPSAVTVTAGNNFKFKVSAKSNTGSTLKYQWQYSKDSGSTWTNSSQKADIYSITAQTDWNGWKYRCIVSDANGNKLTSNAVKLTVKVAPIVINTQPTSTTVTTGNKFTFKVAAASNTGSTLKYQWQYSKDSGSTWTNSSQTTAIYSVTAKQAWNGWYYRCIVTDAAGNSLTSETAKLTVTGPPIEITVQPSAARVIAGNKVTFNVEAQSNTGSTLIYSWEYSKDAGTTWDSLYSSSPSYSETALVAWNGWKYRCLVKDTEGNTVTSDAVLLTVVPSIQITTQPETVSSEEGLKAVFKVDAISNIESTLTYQWQYSKDLGMTWINSAQKTKTYSITAKTTYDKWRYRCIVSDAKGNTVTSDSAMLEVGTEQNDGEVTGICGENLAWNYKDGTLTIFGTGDMYDYHSNGHYTYDYNYIYDETPWNELADDIKKVIVSNGVTSIGNYAFYNCSSLSSITIPDSVMSIGYCAFYNCSSLSSITIPNGVTSIGGSAFSGCSSLRNITLPNGVTSIGGSAFSDCSSLSSITIPDGVTSIGGNAFSECSSLSSITIPNSVTSIGDYAFYNCSSLSSITIPNSVTSIGWYAFSRCSNLSSITIPNSVTSIGWYAFSRCSSLSSVTIPSSVTSIDEDAFYDCSSLKSIIIPDGVTNIGWSAFAYCSSLSSVTIPDSVTSIESYAFSDCNSLSSIIIPSSVTDIESTAFDDDCCIYGCSGSYAEQYAEKNDLEFISFTPPIKITAQPKSTTVVEGKTVSFKVAGNSNIGSTLKYQWQYSKDGGNSWITSSQKTSTYSVTAKITWNGWYYRCIITDAKGNTITSNAVMLTVKPILAITVQPSSTIVTAGQKMTFKVAAESNTGSTLKYQWQYSKDSGNTWTNSSQTTAVYSVTAKSAWNGWRYRCIVTDTAGNSLTSNAAKLTVNTAIESPIEITSQPSAARVISGNNLNFKVAAKSNVGSTLNYQWQYSKDAGITWISTDQKTQTYSIAARTSWNSWLYRCLVTDTKGNTITSDSALLTIVPAIQITSQPVNSGGEEGTMVTYTVSAISNTGSQLTYQWQYSKDRGTTWINSAQKTDTYSITAKSIYDNWLYRCVISDAQGNTVTSDSANMDICEPAQDVTPTEHTIDDKESVLLQN